MLTPSQYCSFSHYYYIYGNIVVTRNTWIVIHRMRCHWKFTFPKIQPITEQKKRCYDCLGKSVLVHSLGKGLSQMVNTGKRVKLCPELIYSVNRIQNENKVITIFPYLISPHVFFPLLNLKHFNQNLFHYFYKVFTFIFNFFPSEHCHLKLKWFPLVNFFWEKSDFLVAVGGSSHLQFLRRSLWNC